MARQWTRATVRLGGIATALTLTCALVPFETAFAAGTESAPPPSAAQVDAASAPAPEVVADWKEPTASVDEKPADVVDGSLKARGKSPNSKLRPRRTQTSCPSNSTLRSTYSVTKSRLHRRALQLAVGMSALLQPMILTGRACGA